MHHYQGLSKVVGPCLHNTHHLIGGKSIVANNHSLIVTVRESSRNSRHREADCEQMIQQRLWPDPCVVWPPSPAYFPILGTWGCLRHSDSTPWWTWESRTINKTNWLFIQTALSVTRISESQKWILGRVAHYSESRKLKQENQEFKASLGYTTRLCPKVYNNAMKFCFSIEVLYFNIQYYIYPLFPLLGNRVFHITYFS